MLNGHVLFLFQRYFLICPSFFDWFSSCYCCMWYVSLKHLRILGCLTQNQHGVVQIFLANQLNRFGFVLMCFNNISDICWAIFERPLAKCCRLCRYAHAATSTSAAWSSHHAATTGNASTTTPSAHHHPASGPPGSSPSWMCVMSHCLPSKKHPIETC